MSAKYKQRYEEMENRARAVGYDEFVYPWNGGATGIFRRNQARKTATGAIELRVANLKNGEVVYESHWYTREREA